VPASANARPAMGCAGRSTGHCVARACALPCASSVSEHALAAVGTDVATLCSALDASETWAEWFGSVWGGEAAWAAWKGPEGL
jgi:hypothetical protein